jgi:hypothetical protein
MALRERAPAGVTTYLLEDAAERLLRGRPRAARLLQAQVIERRLDRHGDDPLERVVGMRHGERVALTEGLCEPLGSLSLKQGRGSGCL